MSITCFISLKQCFRPQCPLVYFYQLIGQFVSESYSRVKMRYSRTARCVYIVHCSACQLTQWTQILNCSACQHRNEGTRTLRETGAFLFAPAGLALSRLQDRIKLNRGDCFSLVNCGR